MIFFKALKSTNGRALLGALQLAFPAVSARLALRAFTTPSPLAVPRLAFTEEPQRTWDVQCEGEKVKTYLWGSLEGSNKLALVFHGWNGNAWDLYPVIECLRRQDYSVVSFDQIAHGRSSGRRSNFAQFVRVAQSLAAQLPPLDLVVGHSMGAAVAAVALSQQLKAKAALMIAPPADVRDFVGQFAQSTGLKASTQAGLERTLERQEKVHLAELVPEVVAPELDLPVLIVHDRGDRVVPLSKGERYHRHWRGSQLIVTEGLGHRRILKDQMVHRQIGQFLRSL